MRFLIETNIRRSRQNEITIDPFPFDESFHLLYMPRLESRDFFGGVFAVLAKGGGGTVVRVGLKVAA